MRWRGGRREEIERGLPCNHLPPPLLRPSLSVSCERSPPPASVLSPFSAFVPFRSFSICSSDIGLSIPSVFTIFLGFWSSFGLRVVKRCV